MALKGEDIGERNSGKINGNGEIRNVSPEFRESVYSAIVSEIQGGYRMKPKGLIAITAILAIPAILIAFGQSAPQLINYQGRLTNAAGQPLDGVTVDMTFSFYGAETGGTAYLSVLQEDVLVNGGVYNVLLGSGTITPGTETTFANVFQKHTNVWMGVKVDADAEMIQRVRITSVPFAIFSTTTNLSEIGEFLGKPDWDKDNYPKEGDPSDCNDANSHIYPGAPELCDGIDNQCLGDSGFGRIDEGCFPERCHDVDYDGYYAEPNCGASADCDDNDPNNWVSCSFCLDSDLDTYFVGCDDYITIQGPDCDDSNNDVYPGTTEVCDSIDNNCPLDIGFGYIDETCWQKIGSDVRLYNYPQYLVWNGSEYGYIWGTTSTGSDLVFGRMSLSGSIIGPDKRITNTPDNDRTLGISWTGSEYGMLWYGDTTFFTRISVDGDKVGSDLVLTMQGSILDGRLCFNGNEFIVVLPERFYRNQNYDYINYIRISFDGNVLSSRRESMPPCYSGPRIIQIFDNGSEYGAFFLVDQSYYFNRVSYNMNKIGYDVTIHPSPGPLVWTGEEYISVATDWLYNSYYFSVSKDALNIGPEVEIPLPLSLDFANISAIAWNGHVLGISWEEHDALFTTSITHFATMTPSGSIIGNDLIVCTDCSVGYIISAGEQFGVIYWSYSGWNYSRIGKP